MSFAKVAIFAMMIAHGGDIDVPSVNVPPTRQCGTATVYGYGTKWHGDETATGETFRPRDESTCAHRTIPLGSVIMVDVVGGGSTWCRVNDRGPYMARKRGSDRRVFLGLRLPDGYVWDGIVDLSIRAARDSGMDGKQRVCLRYWSTP